MDFLRPVDVTHRMNHTCSWFVNTSAKQVTISQVKILVHNSGHNTDNIKHNQVRTVTEL